ncbi:hypothetical protein ABZP36_011695 [Zizania latifolia]
MEKGEVSTKGERLAQRSGISPWIQSGDAGPSSSGLGHACLLFGAAQSSSSSVVDRTVERGQPWLSLDGNDLENQAQHESSNSSLVKKDDNSQNEQKANDDLGLDIDSKDLSEDDVLSNIPAYYFQPVGGKGGVSRDTVDKDFLLITDAQPLSSCYNPNLDIDERANDDGSKNLMIQAVEGVEEVLNQPIDDVLCTSEFDNWHKVAIPAIEYSEGALSHMMSDSVAMEHPPVSRGGGGLSSHMDQRQLKGKFKAVEDNQTLVFLVGWVDTFWLDLGLLWQPVVIEADVVARAYKLCSSTAMDVNLMIAISSLINTSRIKLLVKWLVITTFVVDAQPWMPT